MPGMSNTGDFSKRRFAEFIAARLMAKRIEREQQRSSELGPGHNMKSGSETTASGRLDDNSREDKMPLYEQTFPTVPDRDHRHE